MGYSIFRVSDIKPEPINWLWKNRMARGKLTILAGDPGLAKSQLTALFAATTTRGDVWPVDQTPAPRGKVIFLSAEDDAADTIRPRLEVVNAILEDIYILDAVKEDGEQGQRCFNLRQDLVKLEETIEDLGNVTLVIIDPITAYLGGADSHKASDIRALLAPLSDIASRNRVAILGVTHLNKGQSGQAMYRMTGSLAFPAAARAAFVVTKDMEDQERRLLLPVKNNIGDDRSGFAFRIEGTTLENGIETSRIAFEDGLITVDVNEALAGNQDAGTASKLEAAMEFLIDVLKVPLPQTEVERYAQNSGHSLATIRRAKDKLGVKVKKSGMYGGWIWYLPEDDQKSEDDQSKNMSTFVPDDRLRADNDTEQEGMEERLAIDPFDGNSEDEESG